MKIPAKLLVIGALAAAGVSIDAERRDALEKLRTQEERHKEEVQKLIGEKNKLLRLLIETEEPKPKEIELRNAPTDQTVNGKIIKHGIRGSDAEVLP